jgi:ABC-type transporter Mla subunit MlaD
VATAPTAATAPADAIAAMITATLAPLVAELAASRQTIERQAKRVAELERENGRQSAELERALSTIVTLGDELAAERSKSSLTPSTVLGSTEPARIPF